MALVTLLLMIWSCFFIQSSIQEDTTIIVIDAGSSSTKFNLFKFSKEGSTYTLESSLKKIGTALSQFTSENADWESLKSLFETKTTELVEPLGAVDKSKIPIYVRATAGLRQMEVEVSERILKKVSEIVEGLDFLSNSKSVELMSGEDEGKYAWIATNYMKGVFSSTDSQTYGVMDLGGGSTQVVFESHSIKQKNYLKIVEIFGKKYSIYCREYENKGMNVIRLKYFDYYNIKDSEFNGKIPADFEFKSSCMNKDVRRKMVYGDTNITITGTSTASEDSTSSCLEKASNFAADVQPIRSTVKPENMQFIAISAFYYILSNLNPNENGELIAKKIIEGQKEYCVNKPNPTSESSLAYFLCIDLSYMRELLLNRYGFKDSDELLVLKKIDGTKLSWALGLAVSKL